MNLIVDEQFTWQQPGKPPSVARIRIYKKLNQTIVIASESPENKSQSLTNGAEYAIAQTIKHYGLTPQTMLWIENYPPRLPVETRIEDEYHLVQFTYDPKGKTFETPNWIQLSPKEVKKLIEGDNAPLQNLMHRKPTHEEWW
ncbi:MAG: hypothetical protein AAGD25_10085 [Cyanobacteria bacterium P01_F01_bin.150]